MRNSLILFLLLTNICFAMTLDEMKAPAPLMGRINHTDKVEKKSSNVVVNNNLNKSQNITEQKPIIKEEILEEETIEKITSNYADLSLQRLAGDVAYELDIDENKINSDLSTLWIATTSKSETLKYTIYKLSNPDEDKPNESAIKKILKPIANIGSLAGAGFSGDPIVATGALVGGGLVNAFMKDDKEMNYQFSKVSDADMVLLIRKIDTLQKKLIDLYIDYKTKEGIYNLEKENLIKREEIYNLAQNKSKEELTIADVYYRNSKKRVQKAQDEFMTTRAVLENLVGMDAIKKIEEE